MIENIETEVKHLKNLLDSKIKENENLYKFFYSLLTAYVKMKNIPDYNVRNNLLINDFKNIFINKSKNFISNLTRRLKNIIDFYSIDEFGEDFLENILKKRKIIIPDTKKNCQKK